MDNNQKIDELFREKLEGYKPEFIQEHWQLMKPAIENLRVNTSCENAGFKINDIIMIIVTILAISVYLATCAFCEKTCLPNSNNLQTYLLRPPDIINVKKFLNRKNSLVTNDYRRFKKSANSEQNILTKRISPILISPATDGNTKTILLKRLSALSKRNNMIVKDYKNVSPERKFIL